MLVKEARRLLAVLAAEVLHQATTLLNRSRLRSTLISFGRVEGVDEGVVPKAKAVAFELVRLLQIRLCTRMRETQPPSSPLDHWAERHHH